MRTGTPCARQSTKELKKKSVGIITAEKRARRQELKNRVSQKAKALWAMKAAWDRGEEYYDPARKEDILGRTKTRLDLWEGHLNDRIAALAKALECLEISFSAGFWIVVCGCQSWWL